MQIEKLGQQEFTPKVNAEVQVEILKEDFFEFRDIVGSRPSTEDYMYRSSQLSEMSSQTDFEMIDPKEYQRLKQVEINQKFHDKVMRGQESLLDKIDE